MYFSKYARPVKVINEGQDTHGHSCVSDIEGRPREERVQVDTDEIGYVVRRAEAVYQIANSPAHNQSEGRYAQAVSRGEAMKKEGDNQQTSYADRDDKTSLMGKQAEGGAVVPDEH
jgi:hypothetical protein